jgi:transcriptional regulator with XRE-family HTH domain
MVRKEYVTLGEHVRAARRARGWTREELAVRARVSVSTVGRIERGDHQPRAAIVIAIALALGLTPEELGAEAGLEIHPMDPNDKWAR